MSGSRPELTPVRASALRALVAAGRLEAIERGQWADASGVIRCRSRAINHLIFVGLARYARPATPDHRVVEPTAKGRAWLDTEDGPRAPAVTPETVAALAWIVARRLSRRSRDRLLAYERGAAGDNTSAIDDALLRDRLIDPSGVITAAGIAVAHAARQGAQR